MTATLEAVEDSIELVPAIECEQLRISTTGVEGKVDRNAKVISGFVVAQLGPFRTQGRGEFDDRSLKQIVRLMKLDPDGLPSYYGHPNPVAPEQLGRLLGRAKNPRIETIGVLRNGENKAVQAVLADLHLSTTAFENNPNGNIGEYIMELAETDPRSFAASLVLEAAKEHRLNRGRPMLDETGMPLPPIFRPLQLASIDVVQRGEAVDSFLPTRLSANQDFFSVLDSVFSGDEMLSVKSDIEAMVARYLSYRFSSEPVVGTSTPPPAAPAITAVSSDPERSDDALLLDLWIETEE